MKRAYLYIRVSTDEQADKGYSLRYQDERLTKYCELQGIKIVALFKEDHSAKTFDRPEFEKMLAIMKRKKGMADLLLFTKWDRFSRNAGDAYGMINQLNRLGVEPQAIEQPLDLNIPENKIMLAFYLASPEVENDRRALNTFVGMRRARKEGRCVSTAPKGYKNTRNELNKKIIVPSEDAKHIKFAFEELAKGVHTVVDVWKMATAKGFKYSKSNFFTLIRNPIYCGLIKVPAYKDEGETLVKGQHEPIVSESIFFEVQDILDGRKRNVPTKNTRRDELPLRGFLTCPQCGRTMTGSASKGAGGRYFYYHCYPGCKERVKAEFANDEFLMLLEKVTFNQEVIDLFADEIAQVFRQNQVSHVQRARVLKGEIEKLRQRLNKAQQLMLDGEMRMEEYRDLKSGTEGEITRLEREYLQIGTRDSDYERYVKFGRNILKNLALYYSQGDVALKQGIISSIFSEKLVFSEHRYRTLKVAKTVERICPNISDLLGHKTENGSDNRSRSCMVASTGIEPVFKV